MLLLYLCFMHSIPVPFCSLGGGGVELTENYPRWKTQFVGLDSYQQMQTSMNKLVECKFKHVNSQYRTYNGSSYLKPTSSQSRVHQHS